MGFLIIKERVNLFILKFLSLLALIFIGVVGITEATASISDSTDIKSVSEILVDNNGDGELDLLGQNLTLAGRATVGSSVLHNQYLMIYLQDSSAGVLVFSDTLQHTVNRGDSLIVTGELQLYYGKPEIVVDNLKIIKTKLRMPEPIKLSGVFKNPENYTGLLVEGEALVTGKDYDPKFTSLTVSTSDTASNSLTIYVPKEHFYHHDFNFDMLSVGDFVYVKGIVDSYTFKNSDKTIFNIRPRTPEDLQYAGIPRRFMNILLLVGGFLFIGIIGWIYALKKQVASKTGHLSQALNEKNMLMQEIHHRVKNNLAVVSSFLQLQKFNSDDEQLKRILSDSEMRIQTMALIHEQLYKTESFSKINIEDYLQKLITSLKEIHDPARNIRLHISCDNITLNVNQAVPCAMIINELISNAYEHAFVDTERGNIAITLTEKKGTIMLIIHDDGCGFPADFEQDSTESLGYTIVDTLTRQLKADFNLRNNQGTHIRLTFEKAEVKGSSSSIT